MKTNTAAVIDRPRTHEGAPAARITPEQELRRLAATCLLWEDNFYESGKAVGERIAELVPKCRPEFVAACAYEMRTKQKLRHAPLLLVREMLRSPAHKALVSKLLPDVIQRADEIAEFVAIYWKGGKRPLAAQAKKGLAAAFRKFDEYQFAKYNRDAQVKLRDVMFLVCPKPEGKEQEALFKKIADDTLTTPDTWEVQLSAGKDKRETFERLMAEKNLGALAYLRNLRNMRDSGVPEQAVKDYAATLDITRVLPFRFIAAARAVPQWEPIIEPLMLKACEGREKLKGRTVLLVDCSGSMDAMLSGKSDLRRLDAACGVAILLRELCENVEVLTFSDDVRVVPPRRGFALRDAIGRTRGGTYLGRAVAHANGQQYDRLIVLTDEQSHDVVGAPKGDGYMINLASNRNGVGYENKWIHVDGWSEAVIDYVQQYEAV